MPEVVDRVEVEVKAAAAAVEESLAEADIMEGVKVEVFAAGVVLGVRQAAVAEQKEAVGVVVAMRVAGMVAVDKEVGRWGGGETAVAVPLAGGQSGM